MNIKHHQILVNNLVNNCHLVATNDAIYEQLVCNLV